jgi:hypothetical protein
VPLLCCLALGACHRDIRNESAVRQGVLNYLSTRPGLNISSMNVSIVSMIFRQDEVDATVAFAPKGSGTAQSMTMHYLLERKGDRWVVKPRLNAGQNPHGDMSTSPHGGIGTPEGGARSGALPPGHPAIPPGDSGPQ